MSEDPYIQILKFAKEHLKEGIKHHEAQQLIIEKLEIKGGRKRENKSLLDRVHNSIFGAQSTHKENEQYDHMCMEAYFQLLEYEELKEAREASLKAQGAAKLATYLAAGALFLAVVVGGIQIYLAIPS